MGCLTAQPIVHGIEQELQGAATLQKVDVNTAEGGGIMRGYGLVAVPSIVVLSPDGQVLYRAMGMPDAPAIKAAVLSAAGP